MAESPPRRRGRPTAHDDVPHETEVLEKGLQAFAELGYEGTSMRVLAQRLGVSHGFIVARYGTKDAFWRATIDFARTQFMAPLESLLALARQQDHPEAQNEDPAQFIAITRAVLQQSIQTPALMRILDEESRCDGPRLDHLTTILIQPLHEAMAPLATRLVEQGHIRPAQPAAVEFTILAMARAITAEPLLNRLGASYTSNPTHFIDTLTTILLTGILAKPDA